MQACPTCRAAFKQDTIKLNFELMSLLEENVPLNEVYELFVLDTSSSMWYSDNRWTLGLIGQSRLDTAKNYITTIVNGRMLDKNARLKTAPDQFMGLLSFDIACNLQIPYSTPQVFLGNLAEAKLDPTGKETCIYDAIAEAVNELDKHRSAVRRLIFLTDGGDTSRSAKHNQDKHQAMGDQLKSSLKRLGVTMFYFNVGGNSRSGKALADELEAKYDELTADNLDAKAAAYLRANPVPTQAASILKLETLEFPEVPAHEPGRNNIAAQVQQQDTAPLSPPSSTRSPVSPARSSVSQSKSGASSVRGSSSSSKAESKQVELNVL